MAADSRSPRDGKHLEVLGYYKSTIPCQARMGEKEWVCTSTGYWLSVGAQPSEPVQRILFRSGLLPPPPMVALGRKGGPRNTRPVHPMTWLIGMLPPGSSYQLGINQSANGEATTSTP